MVAKGLAGKGHDVTVVASKDSTGGSYELYRTIPSGYRGLHGELEHYEKYKDLILSGEWNLVMSHEHFFPSYKLKLEKTNLIWHIHDLQPSRSPPPVKVPMFARSQFHRDYLMKAWGVELGYRYNPIDVDHYRFRENREDWMLFLGRIDVKGALEFIKICREADVKGVIAGEDSPERGINQTVVWKVIKECNEEPEHFTYLGRISENLKVNLLSKAKALIVPFTGEYLPVFDITLLEASASGCPVLVRNRGAVRELIRHGETGFVTETVKEVAEYIGRLDEIEPSACRRWVSLNFNTEQMVNKYEELLADV
ncbi:MAG: glycosyltransferase [Alphaproteobacteria bacterium]|nr:glycosyltransferase [Alphaproteobacteria bacterium]